MSRSTAIDEPIELSALLPEDVLGEVAGKYADLHGYGVAVFDRAGADKVAVAIGAEIKLDVVRELAREDGPISKLGLRYHRALIRHEGSTLGVVVVGPIAADSAQDDERAAQLSRHIVGILELLLYSAYQRYLTTMMHVAAMEEAYAGLQKKNRQLSVAIERLEEADRLKSNFLATVSHELRTPLTSVIGYSEMLLEGLAGPLSADQKEYVQTVLSKADQLLQLITGLLDASLLDRGELQIVRKAVDVVEMLKAVAAAFASQARQRRLAVVVEPYSGPRVEADERKIRQVLWNLLANAIKFTPKGGQIRLDASVGPASPRGDGGRFGVPEDGDTDGSPSVRLRVIDNGIGISPEKQRHIFEPFFQVDSSSTREYGGTGLGLTLAKRYVEAHGGQIWVDSCLGRGSTFTFSLPAVADELETGAKAAAERDRVDPSSQGL